MLILSNLAKMNEIILLLPLFLVLMATTLAKSEFVGPPETTVDLFPTQNDIILGDDDENMVDQKIVEDPDNDEDVELGQDDHEKQRLEQLLAKLSRVLNQVRTMKLKLRRMGRTDAATEEEDTAKIRKELEREVVSITTDDILYISDVKSEKRAVDLTQERFLPRINIGRAAGMGDFTEPPNLNDLGCVGALPIRCNLGSRWRTISGICNNPVNYHWGSMSARFARFLPPQYSDGRNMPRGFYNRSVGHASFQDSETSCNCASDPKRPLPSARLITSKFHLPLDRSHSRLTYMFTQFGQFLDHDITLTPENDKLKCCGDDEGHGECFPIAVPAGDGVFGDRTSCLNFARSIVFCKENYHVREQMNAVTSFLDLSAIYGSALNETEFLRGKKGSLKTSGSDDGHWRLAPFRKKRYVSGDVRADEIPGLLGMHTVFIREHNRIARFLRRRRPQWSGEEVFQRARWISIAQFQNIVYRQYLPVLLGKRAMEKYRLVPKYGGGAGDRYFPSVDPSIRNSFATAAFRFGHSMIREVFNMYSPKNSNKIIESYRLKDNFFNSTKYSVRGGHGMTETMVGQLLSPSMSCDPFFVSDITNSLFDNLLDVASDLPARNIQRGREHGLPPYIDFRQYCGLPRCCSWSSRPDEISPAHWDRLRQIYASPADIDLYTGGLAESPDADSVVGPTFGCLIARQFEALKFGDRFFYTLQDKASGALRMTPGQLDAVSPRSLGDLMCDNTDLQWMRKDAFFLDTDWIKCGQHNKLNLEQFIEDVRPSLKSPSDNFDTAQNVPPPKNPKNPVLPVPDEPIQEPMSTYEGPQQPFTEVDITEGAAEDIPVVEHIDNVEDVPW